MGIRVTAILMSVALGFYWTASLPAIASGQELKGARGIEAARAGGVIIVCRHGITDSADENEQTLKYDDPSTQRRLNAAGERQSRDVGESFRALRIDVDDVIASPMQRTRLTAELAFGRATLDSNWHTRGDNYEGPKKTARLAQLGRDVPRGVRVIVSHIGTIYSVIPSITGELNEGDCVVIRPKESRFEVIEVVPWRSWLAAAGGPRRPRRP